MPITCSDQFPLCLGFFANGCTNCAEISRGTGVHVRTVRRYLKAYLEKKPVEHVGRNGRPPKLTHPCKKSIAQIVRHHPAISSSEIASKVEKNMGILMAPSTVRKALQLMNYVSKKPRNVPMLLKRHKEARVRFALKYRDLDWSRVIFSDESFVQLFSNSLKLWTLKSAFRENPQAKDRTKVMFWGAFCQKMKSETHFIEGKMTGTVYRGILRNHVIPFIKTLNNGFMTRRNRFIYQQDNDPKHTSKVAKKFIETSGIQLLDWPSCSPDLNPIENLWSIVKMKVYKTFPDNRIELKERLIHEWNNIKQETIDNLVNSMPRRLDLILENNGNRINY
jgi:transposase